MILYTILNPADVLLSQENENIAEAGKSAECITDPYFFLEKDEYYSKYINKRS
ncbi:MAG: hypothetical protein ACI4I9_08620 [Porcipelethomonas sp.]